MGRGRPRALRVNQTPKVSPLKHFDRPGLLIQTPYDEFFAGQLKGMVPVEDRWFDWNRTGWWVAEEYRDVILHLIREAFGGFIVVEDDGREVTHEASGERVEQGRLL